MILYVYILLFPFTNSFIVPTIRGMEANLLQCCREPSDGGKKTTWNTFIYVYTYVFVFVSFARFSEGSPVYQKCTLQLIIIINGNKYTNLFSSEWNHSYCSGHRPIGAAPRSYSEHFLSIGTRVSYKVGACSMIPAVPAKTANVNIHKKSRSNTIATYFQSSLVWMWK